MADGIGSKAITYSVDIQQKVIAACVNQGVDPFLGLAVAQIESKGDQNAVSPKGAVGVMQLMPTTFNGIIDPNTKKPYTDIHDVDQNIQAGVQYLKQQLNAFQNNVPLSLAAYNAGPGRVIKAGYTIPQNNETPKYVANILGIHQQISGGAGVDNSSVTTAATVTQWNSPRPTAPFEKLSINDVDDSTYKALNPSVVITEGLSVTPWFNDEGIVITNPRIKGFTAPVSFLLSLVDGSGPFILTNDPKSQGKMGAPIELRLNASLRNFNKQMKHVFTKVLTRTGFHVTMWGMQADLIEGSGSTGVFMNQLGITDFLSQADVSSELVDLIYQGFKHTSNATADTPAFDANGNLLDSSPDVFTQVVQEYTNQMPSNWRIAAQDAFIELMSLFQNNGTVWFNSEQRKQELQGKDMVGQNAWSTTLGASSKQMHARNNDVMSRGSVIMRIKGETYEGFFKTLSWVQDASNPYQWNFTFVFQVERTLSLLYLPQPQ